MQARNAHTVTFRDKLCELREHLDITQEAMGLLLGVSRNYVSMMESEEDPREPSRTVKMLFGQLWKKHMEDRTDSIGAEQPIESEFSHGAGRPCLKRAREAAGLSQLQLAKEVGYSLSVYQNIEEGRSNLSRKMAERLANVLKIPVDDLLGGGDHVPENTVPYGTMGETPAIKLPPGLKAKYVPLLAMCECGPSMAFDDGGYEYAGFVAFNINDPLAFAVKLSGDSMTPQYWPGDVAVITPSKPLRNGAVVIARISEEQEKQHGGEVMCKLYQASGDSVTLSSYNPAFPPMTFPRRAFNWIYPVAQVTKTLD